MSKRIIPKSLQNAGQNVSSEISPRIKRIQSEIGSIRFFDQWRSDVGLNISECASFFGCTTRNISRIRCGLRKITLAERAGMEFLLGMVEKNYDIMEIRSKLRQLAEGD